MKRFRNSLPAMLIWLACLFLCSGNAGAYFIDGHMDDWGIPAWTGFSTSDNVNAPVVGYQNGVFYWEEDGVGSGGYANANGWVEPGYGGQEYDIEAFYVSMDQSNLYIAVISGGKNLSDIGIDVNNDNIYEYGIDTATGKFYSGLTSNDWTLVPYSQHNISDPADIKTNGKLFTQLTYFYNKGYLTSSDSSLGNLYVFETAINLSNISWDTLVDFHVTQWCGNDVANQTVHTPEPATMVLLGTGLLGLAGYARRMRKNQLKEQL